MKCFLEVLSKRNLLSEKSLIGKHKLILDSLERKCLNKNISQAENLSTKKADKTSTIEDTTDNELFWAHSLRIVATTIYLTFFSDFLLIM